MTSIPGIIPKPIRDGFGGGSSHNCLDRAVPINTFKNYPVGSSVPIFFVQVECRVCGKRRTFDFEMEEVTN